MLPYFRQGLSRVYYGPDHLQLVEQATVSSVRNTGSHGIGQLVREGCKGPEAAPAPQHWWQMEINASYVGEKGGEVESLAAK